MDINEMLNQIKKDMDGMDEKPVSKKTNEDQSDKENPLDVIKDLLAEKGINIDKDDTIEIKKLSDLKKEVILNMLDDEEKSDITNMPPLPVFMMTISALVGAETLTRILVDKNIIEEEELDEVAKEVHINIQKTLIQSLGISM